MDVGSLRERQAPLKARYKDDPATARATLRARGILAPEEAACRVEGASGSADVGLHPMAGGDGSWACSGEMLLQALVGCAGVTCAAVARAMGLPLRGGTVEAEGEMDFRGTLGVSRDVPVGFTAIRLQITLDTDADEAQRAKLLELTERYCVIYQTLQQTPTLSATLARVGD